jgi:hypothetical protein
MTVDLIHNLYNTRDTAMQMIHSIYQVAMHNFLYMQLILIHLPTNQRYPHTKNPRPTINA